MGIAELGHAPCQVYVVRKGEYSEVERTCCLVTYQTAAEAYAAVDDIHGMEVPLLADFPLQCEVATLHPRSDYQCPPQV